MHIITPHTRMQSSKDLAGHQWNIPVESYFISVFSKSKSLAWSSAIPTVSPLLLAPFPPPLLRLVGLWRKWMRDPEPRPGVVINSTGGTCSSKTHAPPPSGLCAVYLPYKRERVASLTAGYTYVISCFSSIYLKKKVVTHSPCLVKPLLLTYITISNWKKHKTFPSWGKSYKNGFTKVHTRWKEASIALRPVRRRWVSAEWLQYTKKTKLPLVATRK